MAGSIIVSVLALSAAVNASEVRSMDYYRSIVDRNPFGLKPVPPPPIQPVVSNAPAAKNEQFYLTGISTVGYPAKPKKAFLMNKDNSKKDYNEKYYNMQINDKMGDLQLNDIDEKGKRVKVTYRGEEMWLSMKDNGVPTPTGTAAPQPGMPAAVPAIPGAPGINPMPLPGATSLPQANVAQPTVTPSNPSMRRLPRGNQFGNSGNMGMSGGAVYAPSIPGAAGNPYNAAPPPNSGPQVSPVDTAVQQAINMGVEASQGGPPVPPMLDGP